MKQYYVYQKDDIMIEESSINNYIFRAVLRILGWYFPNSKTAQAKEPFNKIHVVDVAC